MKRAWLGTKMAVVFAINLPESGVATGAAAVLLPPKRPLRTSAIGSRG